MDESWVAAAELHGLNNLYLYPNEVAALALDKLESTGSDQLSMCITCISQ
jgi:hypothetical protein